MRIGKPAIMTTPGTASIFYPFQFLDFCSTAVDSTPAIARRGLAFGHRGGRRLTVGRARGQTSL